MDLNQNRILCQNYVYEIEKIVDKRFENGQLQYLVKVRGFIAPQWFSMRDIQDSFPLIVQYEEESARVGNMGHGYPTFRNNMEVMIEGIKTNQQLLAQVVPRVTKMEVDLGGVKGVQRDHEQRLAAVELQLQARAGPSGSGVVVASANEVVEESKGAQEQPGQEQGPRALSNDGNVDMAMAEWAQQQLQQRTGACKVPCPKCEKLLAFGYVLTHLSKKRCNKPSGRQAKRHALYN